MSNNYLRFGISDGNKYQAVIWNCFTRKKSSDFYLTCRSLSALKVSLHESGSWQVGYTKEFWDGNQDSIPAGLSRRHLELWQRPQEVEPGITLAVRIITPFSAVNLPLDATNFKNIQWIPSAPAGMVTEISIFLTKPIKNWPGKKSLNTKLIASMPLPNGEFVWLVYWAYQMPNAFQFPTVPHFFKGKGVTDLKSQSLRSLLIGKEPDGSRTLYDFPMTVKNDK